MKHWRAKEGCKYYYIDTCNGWIEQNIDCRWNGDNTKYRMGNYFKTKKQANEVLRKINSILKEYHK